MGHVVDLPKSTLAVDVEHDFAPDFEVVRDKQKVISELKAAAKGVTSIILATDPDREGEAIAAHIAKLLTIDGRKSKVDLGARKKVNIDKEKIDLLAYSFNNPSSTVNHLPSISRIVFHEITKEAIEEAFKHPRAIDENLVNAQTARRVLDRLVGYKLSPLLWQKVRRGLSAGRVQSVALRLIVEREREIEKFGKEQYWTILAILASQGSTLQEGTEFELIEVDGKKIETQEVFHLYDGDYKVTRTTIVKEEDAKKIVAALQGKEFIVADVLQKEIHRSPLPPYTTSTLQQDAAHRLGLNGKRTMSIAQKLYEEGYITYHRTDSVTISASAVSAFRAFAQKEYGDKYIPEKPRMYSAKQKLAQEAHEAIRPTSAKGIADLRFKIQDEIGNQHWKLYELIWKRAIASQMSDAVIESTTVIVTASTFDKLSARQSSSKKIATSSETIGTPRNDNHEYKFKANGSVLMFDGFLRVNPQALQDNRLPQFSAKQNLDLINAQSVFHETPPPPRYNDASLIKTLEEKGIGRPSTYAGIVSTIEGRTYIERLEGRFCPTSIGIAVNDFLVANFSDIDDIPFTAHMEDSLDDIAHGKKEWVPVMREFYLPLEKKIAGMKDVARVKIETEQTDEVCPVCKNPLVVRTGKFGKFLACSTFPDCKFTKPFVEKTGVLCPKDGGQVIVKKTKKGRTFFGCSNYPKCDFAAWKLEPPVK